MDSYPGPLGQVVTNLIQNAALHAFDEHGGTITVHARALDAGHLSLSVCDDGKGISAQDAPRVFDPFFTTKLGQGGSGLGLHIAHNLVVGMLGGHIQLRTGLAKGTCMDLTLPCVAPRWGASAGLTTQTTPFSTPPPTS
jgi:signal transduction histidine kinase